MQHERNEIHTVSMSYNMFKDEYKMDPINFVDVTRFWMFIVWLFMKDKFDIFSHPYVTMLNVISSVIDFDIIYKGTISLKLIRQPFNFNEMVPL